MFILIFLILLSFVVFPVLLLLSLNERREAFARERGEAIRIVEERYARLEAAKDAFKSEVRNEWAVNECKFRQEDAFFGLRKDCKVVGIITYAMGDGEFIPGYRIEIPVVELISAKVVCDDIREYFQRTEAVPVAITNKNSPVARAIVGGAILGPAGAVIGAASGLGGRQEIVTEQRKIQDQRMVKGPPRLVVGTSGAHGSLSVQFSLQSHAEHWLNQIQSARLNLGLPMLN